MDAFDDFGGDHEEEEELETVVEKEVIHQNEMNERRFHIAEYEEIQGS